MFKNVTRYEANDPPKVSHVSIFLAARLTIGLTFFIEKMGIVSKFFADSGESSDSSP